MLNEEKIKLMTDLAVYEKRNIRRMQNVTGYFKNDYISRNMIRGFLSFTCCFLLILTIRVLFHMDLFISTIGLDSLAAFTRKAAVFYGIGLCIYLVLVYTVYAKRYDDEYRKVRIYTAKLKHLNNRYDYHNRSKELTREGRRV